MLKEFIAHIQKTTQPLIQQIGSSTFAINGDGNVREIRPTIDHPDTLPLHSLEALVKMVQTEAANMDAPLYITIPNHLTVYCFGQPDADARYFRQVYYETKATDVPRFSDGFREQERAIIELRSKFAPGDGVDYLLDLLSRISKDSNVTTMTAKGPLGGRYPVGQGGINFTTSSATICVVYALNQLAISLEQSD